MHESECVDWFVLPFPRAEAFLGWWKRRKLRHVVDRRLTVADVEELALTPRDDSLELVGRRLVTHLSKTRPNLNNAAHTLAAAKVRHQMRQIGELAGMRRRSLAFLDIVEGQPHHFSALWFLCFKPRIINEIFIFVNLIVK